MEENTAAVECLILFYINTKHVLKTKQLDERVFLDQMIKHCKENGFNSYTNEEIRNTWKNLTLKYVELKKTGTAEEKEAWKYYEILDSCYEQSDFHNGVYPKFSEEMVWFLIECFLKRKGLEKTQKKNSMLNEIHKDFLQSGYLYITRQDIENKWKYLNFKYDKLKDDPESLNKLPYLQALKGYREKDGKSSVKMIFTRVLTEILIERFTEKKITCVIHGYDSEQVLSEIQSEFKDLGFYFSQEEIKERWRKLTNIYSFLKAKGKHDSPWIYFTAMREHFKDDFLFGFGKFERESRDERQENKSKLSRQRSKSVGADVRKKYNNETNKAKLIVNIEQLDNEKLTPSPPRKLDEEKKLRSLKRKPSPKKLVEDNSYKSKKSRARSKSRENRKLNKNKDVNVKTEDNVVPDQIGSSLSVKKNHPLKKLSIDRNGNQERRGSADISSPGSKVHIINIDESKIDKKSGNLTINLPSITKQFSDNEFLPLKKRLRVGGETTDKHSDDSKDLKDGFRGFPASEISEERSKSDENESKRLTEDEMAEIMKRICQDKAENCGITDNSFSKDKNYFKPDFDYKYQGTYNNFNLLIPKEEQDNLPMQNYNSNTITPPPVLLLVIKVDGSNNPVKDGAESKKEESESPDTNDAEKSKNTVNILETANGCSVNIVKPISTSDKNCTITQSESVEAKTISDAISPQRRKCKSIQSENIVTIQNTEAKTNELNTIQIKNNGPIKVESPKNNCTITVNDRVTIQTPAEKRKEGIMPQNKELFVPAQNFTSVEKNHENTNVVQSVPIVANETVIPAVPQESNTTKKIRLPVQGGGKVKEIFISPKELKKLAKIKPGDFKPTTSPTKTNPTNDISPIKTNLELNSTSRPSPPKFKFISHVIRPPTIETPEKSAQKPRNKVNPVEPTTDVNYMPPPPLVTVAGNAKFVGTNNSSKPYGKQSGKNEEFENESVFSEAVGDDECLKDNLLATVIDFQEQNNQEFVEIKNLMKQNNLLQRETNRLLRLMLEKM